KFLELGARAIRRVATAHRVDLVEVLCDVGPIFVNRVTASGFRGTDDVATAESVEFAHRAQIADFHTIAFRDSVDVEIPVAHAAVNVDVGMDSLGSASRTTIGDFEKTKHWSSKMPVLPHSGLHPIDALQRQLPSNVQPICISD